MDICFVLDSSSTVTRAKWPILLQAVNRFVNSLTIGPSNAQVGIVTYSYDVRLDVRLNQYADKTALTSAIGNIKYLQQNTMTQKGLKMAKDNCFQSSNGDRADAQNILCLISDGGDSDAAASKTEADSIRAQGTKVYGIGYGQISDGVALQDITGDSAAIYTAKDVDAVGAAIPALLQGICNIKTGKLYLYIVQSIILSEP